MPDFFSKKHEDYPDSPKEQEPRFEGQVNKVSFSTLSTFEQCPYAVYLNRIKGIPSVGSKATDRGSKLHELLESYVQGTTDNVNWNLFKAGGYHAPIIESFRKAHSSQLCDVEYQLVFTKDMIPSTWDADDAWLRAAIDVVLHKSNIHVALYDYKTGSNQSAAKHRSQLMLYALLYMLENPEIEKVDVAAMYLDLKIDCFYGEYTRNDIDLYWPRYLIRLQAISDCTNFKPNPNGFTCKWCQHKKINHEIGQIEPACEFAYIG